MALASHSDDSSTTSSASDWEVVGVGRGDTVVAHFDVGILLYRDAVNSGGVVFSRAVHQWRRFVLCLFATDYLEVNGRILRQVGSITTSLFDHGMYWRATFIHRGYGPVIIDYITDEGDFLDNEGEWYVRCYSRVFNLGQIELESPVWSWRRLVLRRLAGYYWGSHNRILRDLRFLHAHRR